jgi:hypothetical protein
MKTSAVPEYTEITAEKKIMFSISLTFTDAEFSDIHAL